MLGELCRKGNSGIIPLQKIVPKDKSFSNLLSNLQFIKFENVITHTYRNTEY